MLLDADVLRRTRTDVFINFLKSFIYFWHVFNVLKIFFCNVITSMVGATDVVSLCVVLQMEVCSAARLEQTIRVRGCQPRTVVNRYCYGQCNSFFIPRAATTAGVSRRRSTASLSSDDSVRRRGRGRGGGRVLAWTAFRSCSYCRPRRVEWITVGLDCPRHRPSYRRRRVQIVKDCACAALTLD